jgi:hypothetical protein
MTPLSPQTKYNQGHVMAMTEGGTASSKGPANWSLLWVIRRHERHALDNLAPCWRHFVVIRRGSVALLGLIEFDARMRAEERSPLA